MFLILGDYMREVSFVIVFVYNGSGVLFCD